MTRKFEEVLKEWNSHPEPDISYRTQFEIEHSCAEAIRETKPFSKERQEITRLGYEAVDRIISLRAAGNESPLESYGANESCFSLLDQLIEHELLSRPQDPFIPIRFFEGGVGTGAVLKHLKKQFGEKLNLSGCDVYLDRDNLGSLQHCCEENTLYHSLKKRPDKSIDVFYWNDVMEHMPEDEMPALLQLLSQKLAPGGLLITITPPAGTGPYDITAFVKPFAGKAMGLHLHEYFFYEIYEAMTAADLEPYAFARKQRSRYSIQYDDPVKRYRRHASYEKFLLKFAYLFPGKFGLFWRRKLMQPFTDASVFTKK